MTTDATDEKPHFSEEEKEYNERESVPYVDDDDKNSKVSKIKKGETIENEQEAQ